jgi:hypothetical protein
MEERDIDDALIEQSSDFCEPDTQEVNYRIFKIDMISKYYT